MRVQISKHGIIAVQFQFQSISAVFVHTEIRIILLLSTKFHVGSACNKEIIGSYGPF